MPTINTDQLKKSIDSVYKLAIIAAKRAQEISHGSKCLVDVPTNTKPVISALAEIVEGKVTYRLAPKKEGEKS